MNIWPLERVSLKTLKSEDDELAAKCGCSPIVAALLRIKYGFGRGDILRAREWLNPSLKSALLSLEYTEEEKEAANVWQRNKGAARVAVYGDYDVDGVCATTLAVEMALKSFLSVRYFIPHRHEQGYGVHKSIIRDLARDRCDLLIVVDCGTRDIEALSEAAKAGIDVLVFDHHAPGDALPKGAVVVNPHVTGSPESKTLCATGVLWKWAVKSRIFDPKWLISKLDLVALATIADSMPLGLLNRALVKAGINVLRKQTRGGLAALAGEMRLNVNVIDEEDLSMRIIPALNAAGRLDLAELSVKVLLGHDNVKTYVQKLIALNRRRQYLSSNLLEELWPLIERGEHVVCDEKWPAGVLSGVASRLCSETGKAIALAAPVGKVIRGTLRVPKGSDALQVLTKVAPYLEAWGGHKFAAGFSVDTKKWDELKERMDNILKDIKPSFEELEVLDISPSCLSLNEVLQIKQLGPFGVGNPAPLFFAKRESPLELLPLGKDGRHFRVKSGKNSYIAFNGASSKDIIIDSYGWIYKPKINYWRGNVKVDMLLDRVVVNQCE